MLLTVLNVAVGIDAGLGHVGDTGACLSNMSTCTSMREQGAIRHILPH